MAVRLLSKETQTFVFDFDGSMYSPEVRDQVFGYIQKLLAINLLHISGTTNPNDEQIAKMHREYLDTQQALGSWTTAFISLGGSRDDYLRIRHTLDISSFLKPNLQLIELVTFLRTQNCQTAVLSSAPSAPVYSGLSILFNRQHAHLFDSVVCDDTPQVHFHKPDPRSFLNLLSQLHSDPTKSVMIGDSDSDILPANGLGMSTVYIGPTSHPTAGISIDRIEKLFAHIRLP